jgi:hypothetical protein
MSQPHTVTIDFVNGDQVTFTSVPLKQNPTQMQDCGAQFVNRVFKKKSPGMHIVSEEDATKLQDMLKAAGTDAARVTSKVGESDARFEIGTVYTVYGNHIAEMEVGDLLLA